MIYRVQNTIWYSVIFVGLAILSVGFLVYEIVVGDSARYASITQLLDLIVAYIFLIDFFIGLAISTWHGGVGNYAKSNILNLLSSIPISSGFIRALRLLRIVRAVRVIRASMTLYEARKRVRGDR